MKEAKNSTFMVSLALHRVIASLFENEMGALACGLHVLPKVHEVDGRPDPARGVARLRLGERGVAMEIGRRVAEHGFAEREEALDVPLLDVGLGRVHVD